ncbi:MAG: Rpn family recombination-promoting nuclease/putative transposase, partial [Acetatifactor sp.]|nr:Rpn family recombination-promoting nuclease/putative transposase [Acetatifactor sp.]
DLFSGQRYDRLKKCIVIDILDFPGDENPGYHKVYHLRDAEGQLYSDQFEVHIIELNKELTGDRVDDWVRLLRVESKEELESMHSGNAGVIRAIDEVRTMNLSRRLKAWYELRLKNQRDRWAIEDAIKEDAYKEGLEKGYNLAGIKSQRQDILDLLEEYGDVPEDILARIYAEETPETLRRWLKAAAHAGSFDNFRAGM